MADEPKISKHHAGQHPALKSFRAFDIIPPSKVKPQHTARPVITSQPKHFDSTLTPPKIDEPKPASAETPKPSEVPDTTVSESTLPVEMPVPAESATTESTPDPSPTTPEAPITDTALDTAATLTESEKPGEEPAAIAQPELAAVPESVPKPAPSAQAANEGDLSSILDQEAGPQTQLNHSQEFKNVLKEFTVQPKDADSAKPIVAVHQHDYLRVVLQVLMWIAIVAVIAAIIVDILLDTGALNLTYNIPHTHFFGK
jgi:hypothetical protein